MGRRPPIGQLTSEELRLAGLVQPQIVNIHQAVVDALADYLPAKIGAEVPMEMSATNSPGPLVAAVALGLQCVDRWVLFVGWVTTADLDESRP